MAKETKSPKKAVPSTDRDELAQVRKDLARLNSTSPEEFVQGKIADFQSAYSIGLIDGRHSQATCEQLLTSLDEAIQKIGA